MQVRLLSQHPMNKLKYKRQHLVSIIVIDGRPYEMWPNTFITLATKGGDSEWNPNPEGAFCPYPRIYSAIKYLLTTHT